MKNERATSKSTAQLTREAPADGDFQREIAEAAVQPAVHGAAAIRQWKTIAHEIDLGKLIAELERQAKLASSGHLERSEAMLITQAHTLEAIFTNLFLRASSAEYLPQFEAYMRLGLKAQGQCRATLETLAAIKNPAPLAFVRQANIVNGAQQVNNPPTMNESSRARESENQPNKLLEQQYEEWLDDRAMQAAISGDSSVEALGAVHGTKDDRG